MTAGYSTTPLADKLGFKPGMRLFIADMPDSVRAEAQVDDLGLEVLAAPCTGIDAAHVFVTERAILDRELNALRQLIAPSGFIWVSWPKKAAKVANTPCLPSAMPNPAAADRLPRSIMPPLMKISG